MRTNVVALADEEYDAVVGPLVAQACELIAHLGSTRGYLLPMVIATLQRYVEDPSGGEHTRTGGPHRPHLRIHMPLSG
jgi:hypothetical protein